MQHHLKHEKQRCGSHRQFSMSGRVRYKAISGKQLSLRTGTVDIPMKQLEEEKDVNQCWLYSEQH